MLHPYERIEACCWSFRSDPNKTISKGGGGKNNSLFRFWKSWGNFWKFHRNFGEFFEKIVGHKIPNFESLYHKNGWSYGKKCLGGNVRHKIDHLLAPFKNFFDFPKITKLSFKIDLFLTKKSRFFVNNLTIVHSIFLKFREKMRHKITRQFF